MPDRSLILVLLASLALLVRVGIALHSAGLVRSKNAAGMIFRHVCDMSLATLAFWAIGASFVEYHGYAIIGIEPRMLFDMRGEAGAETFATLVMVLIATSIVVGALGERTKLLPMCIVSALMGGIVVPIVASWVWRSQGWLLRFGFVDLAGASVIHLTGGVCALVGAIVVGARGGKYNRDGSSNLIPAHNLPLASAGVMLMLAGWLPYVLANAESIAVPSGRIALNVLLAGASGAFVALMLGRLRYGKPDILLTYGGMLGALVAMTAAPHDLTTRAAVLIGAVAGYVVPAATVMLDLRFKIDDPAGVIAVHGVGGFWGTLAAGIFSTNSANEKLRAIAWQGIGALATAAFAAVAATVIFLTLRAAVGLRSSEADEYDGLDLAEHDLNAYPDFQQTMIKSYHMREA